MPDGFLKIEYICGLTSMESNSTLPKDDKVSLRYP